MSLRPRCPLFLLLALTGALPGAAFAVEPGRLEGRWCLIGVSAVEGTQARAIEREWTFLAGGTLRIQSEASADVRMRVGYQLSGEQLRVPELDLALAIERVTGERMTALDEAGRLRYRFERRACEPGDRGAQGGERSRDEPRGR